MVGQMTPTVTSRDLKPLWVSSGVMKFNQGVQGVSLNAMSKRRRRASTFSESLKNLLPIFSQLVVQKCLTGRKTEHIGGFLLKCYCTTKRDPPSRVDWPGQSYHRWSREKLTQVSAKFTARNLLHSERFSFVSGKMTFSLLQDKNS